MSFHNSQCKKMHCRSKRSNNMAWAAIVAFGILGAAVAEGVSVASLATRSRDLHTTPTHVDMRPSSQDREGGDPSQCTADLIHPGNGDPAEVPAPYASLQIAPTSNPSTPSPSSTLQVASPYALPSTVMLAPPFPPPPVTSSTPAATPPPSSMQLPPPSLQSPPLPLLATTRPTTPHPPSPGIPPDTAGHTTTNPDFTSSAAASSPVTAPPEAQTVPATPSGTPLTDLSGAFPSPLFAASPLDTFQAPGTTSATTATGPPSSLAASLAAPFTPSNPPSTTTGAGSSPGAARNANSSPPQLQFAVIPYGFQPLVTAQATFVAIPAASLTAAQAAEVASELQQALVNVTRTTLHVRAEVVPINAAPAAAAPFANRRHLLQAGNTLQATVLFTATFATPPGSQSAVQASVQAAVATAVAPLSVTTSATSTAPASYDVAIVFPANNQVASSASQGTLAAATFLAGLRSSPTTQLAALAASQGPFTVTSSQIKDELVSLTPASVLPAPVSTPFTIPADLGSISSPSITAAAPQVIPASNPATTSAATPPSLRAFASPVGNTGTARPSSPAPVAEPTPTAPPVPAAAIPADATAGTPSGVSQAPPSTPAPPTAAGQAPPPPPSSPIPRGDGPPMAVAGPASGTMAAPGGNAPAASASPTPKPGEAAPEATPSSPFLTMNLSVGFPPFGIAAAQDLANMLFNQSQRDLYAVVSKNGDIVFSNIVYGSQPTPIPSFAPAPAPGAGGPATLPPAPLGAAAPEALPPPLTSGAAIESFTEPAPPTPSLAAVSGQLYAINMQYGVGGASTNALANLLVFSSNSSEPPIASDFTVQLGNPAQAGNVSVLSTYTSPSDYLIRVECPESYKGPVTVGYASQAIHAVNYDVVDSALLVKVTASTATQQ